jgi:tRNA pseudouridine65 synthase
MIPILYQDERCIVVDKPRGMMVHRGSQPCEDSEVLLQSLRDQAGLKVYVVHRLDRPTSGIILLALDPAAEAGLRAQFEQRRTSKTYLAVCRGDPGESGLIDNMMSGRDQEPDRLVRCVTAWKRLALADAGHLSLVEVVPETGRFHQIRRHFAGLGHPLLGDWLYGDHDLNRTWEERGVARLMLHALSLAFFHPDDSRLIQLSAPWPAEFARFRS